MHGACKGADQIAGMICVELGIKETGYPANWNKYGRAAGAIRNRFMLDKNPDCVIAFHNNLESSRGTKDCVTEALRRGKPVLLISYSK